jgi:hypothetical protein
VGREELERDSECECDEADREALGELELRVEVTQELLVRFSDLLGELVAEVDLECEDERDSEEWDSEERDSRRDSDERRPSEEEEPEFDGEAAARIFGEAVVAKDRGEEEVEVGTVVRLGD